MTPAFNQWFSPKSHTQGIFNWRRVLRTYILMFCLIWYEVIIGLKCRILALFMFIKAKNYLAPNFTTEDFRIQVRVPPVNYVYACHLGSSDMYLTEKASFKDILFIGMHQEEPRPGPQDRVSDCNLSRCKHPDSFPILHVLRIYLRGYFCCSCYALDGMSSRWNHNKFSTLIGYMYESTGEF